MLIAKFLRFRRKGLEKQTHIDNFLYFLYIVLYLKKKIRSIFEKKNEQNFENNFCKFFIFKKSRLIFEKKNKKKC